MAEGKKPDYRVYVVEKREGKDDFWTNVGTAFTHDDREGMNVLLSALPKDGKLVIRKYTEKPKEDDGKL